MAPVYFDIISRIVGLEAAAAEVVGKSVKAGEQAGTGFADAFKQKVLGESAGMSASMTAQVNSAASALESASVRTVKAKDNDANAAGRVRIAEQQLAEARTKYAAESSQVVAAEERLEKAKRANITTSRDVVAATANEGRAQETLAAKHDAVAKSAGGLGLAMKGAAVGGVAALGIGMAEAVKTAGDFQSSQTQLVTTAGESKAALAGVSKGLLDMAGQVGYSAQDLSKAMYTVESGGYHGADGLVVMKAAAQGAAQEHADLKEVVDAVTTTLQDYHLPATQAATVTGEMVAAVSHGKTTFGEFTSALGQVQASAASAKVPMDDLYASLSQMTIHGISAEQGAQNLNRAITTLQKPSADMTTALANIGISSADLGDSLGTKGLSGTLEQISTAIMQHMGPAGKVMVDAFNQSKVAAADVAKAYEALPDKLKAVADKVKAGDLKPTVGALETSAGLSLDEAHMVSQWAGMEAKSTGLNSNLTSLKNSDQTYQQMLIRATGNQETARVAANITGDENFGQVQATRAAVRGAGPENAAGDVRGWSEVQGNFNQKLAETKSAVGAFAIEAGDHLLPVATKMLGTVQESVSWLGKHKSAFAELGREISSDVVPILSKVGTVLGDVSHWLMDGAHWLGEHKAVMQDAMHVAIDLGAVWLGWKAATTTFSLVKAGIGGITGTIGTVKTAATSAASAWTTISSGASSAAGLVRDYWNWTGKFKVQAAADFVSTKASAVAESASTAAAWIGSQVSAGAGWVAMQTKAVGAFVATKVSAATEAVTTAGSWVAAQATAGAGWVGMQAKAIAAFLATKVSAGVNAVETAGLWVAQNAKAVASFVAVEGAAIAAGVAQKGMAAAAWLVDAAMDANPIGLVIAAIAALVVGVIYAWNHFTWFKDAVLDVWKWMKEAGAWIGKEFMDIWHGLGDGVHAALTIVHDTWNWVYDHAIKPTGKLIGDALGLVKTGFKDTVDWISDQWGKVEKIVGTPAVAIIDLVYNDGIVKLWNGIAGVFHLGTLNPVDTSKIPHYAFGGVLPGYSPGVDNHVIAVGGGEAVMRPEWTNAVGADYVHAANAAARTGGAAAVQSLGLPHFDTGGIVGDIANIGKSIIGGAVDVAKFTGKLATDPVGAVKDLFKPIIDKAAGTPDGGSDQGTSQWRDMLIGIPSQMVSAVIDQAKSWLSGGGGSSAPGVPWVGNPDVDGWIAKAIEIAGVGAGWIPGLKTIIGRESSGNPNAINNWDSNAAAGDPSRGLMQTIGSTFERYRNKSLPDNIYDPIANIVAGIGYIQGEYNVSADGSDLAAKVQQADSSRPPHGYALGGIVPGFANGGVTSTKKAASGPEVALQQVREHLNTMYAWGGSDLATGVDCTGLVGDAIQIAEGFLNPTQRLGDTNSLIAGGWPHVLSGASQNDVFAIGANKDHAAATILGTSIEARQQGEKIRWGTDAVTAWDPQFTWHGHLDPSVFSPAYTGELASSSTVKSKTPQEKAAKLRQSEQKANDAAKKSDDAAVKHDQQAAKYDDDAKHAQQLADKSMGAARDRHLKAVQSYQEKAKAARAAAEKARQQADDHRKKAADYEQKAKTAESTPDTATGKKGTSSSGSGSDHLMTFEEAGQKAGGIAADAFLETFGLQDTLLADPNKSPLLKVAGSLSNLQVQGKPLFVNPLAHLGPQYLTQPTAQNGTTSTNSSPVQQAQEIPLTTGTQTAQAIPEELKVTNSDDMSSDLDPTHDLGGLLPPGLSIVNNKLGHGEIMVSPQDKLKPAEQPAAAPSLGNSGPLMMINEWHQHTGGGQEDARAIAREMAVAFASLPR